MSDRDQIHNKDQNRTMTIWQVDLTCIMYSRYDLGGVLVEDD